MALATKKKQAIIKKVHLHEKDTGSPEAQIGVLSEQIEALAKHLKKHQKDNHSRRGLLKMVSDRRAMMNYLSKKDPKRYDTLAKKLDLKKSK
jgi:small subunit ribosomal protein S15